jgi:hypothetical protein
MATSWKRKPRPVHLRVPHRSHDRSNAAIGSTRGVVAPACIPGIVLRPGYRYVLRDDPAVVTCQPCRASWEFQEQVRRRVAATATRLAQVEGRRVMPRVRNPTTWDEEAMSLADARKRLESIGRNARRLGPVQQAERLAANTVVIEQMQLSRDARLVLVERIKQRVEAPRGEQKNGEHSIGPTGPPAPFIRRGYKCPE